MNAVVTQPYASPRDHLNDELALVHTLVERQIRAHWELGLLPKVKDEYSGKFVSGSEISALLEGGLAPSAQGVERVTALDEAARQQFDEIEARLKATRAEGRLLPFDRLRATFDLSITEQRTLWTLIAVDVSPRIRALVKFLVNDATRVYADIALLELLVYSSPVARDLMVPEMSPEGRLFRQRLVEGVGQRKPDDAHWSLRPLRVSRRLVELVNGVVRLDPELDAYAQLIDPVSPVDLLMPAGLVHRVKTLLALGGGIIAERPVVLLCGKEGSGRKSLVSRAAASAHRAVLRVQCNELPVELEDMSRVLRGLFREATLFQAVVILEGVEMFMAGDGNDAAASLRVRRLARVLDDFHVPVAATSGPAEGRTLQIGRAVVRLDVPIPEEAAREELWRRALGEQHQLDFSKVAASYPVTGQTIFHVARVAGVLAGTRGGGAVTADDIQAGLRTVLDEKIASLGVRVTWRQSWEDVVLPDDTMTGVKEFIARVKHRRRVYEEWGFSRKMSKGLGLSALFVGPPGTGKTMIAGIIADELGLDLYQIDLARIVSKYIGETQKNLSEVFDAAEAGHAILLFDEADSLFAKRGEVKSANDRYANMEVNYLLQRIERFRGISLLTTNLEASIDPAFMRRLTVKLDFPMPKPPEREKLWRSMFPKEAIVSPDIDFGSLARRYEMSGGHIRNAVLRAAFLAAEESREIGMDHITRAATLEYMAMRKVI